MDDSYFNHEKEEELGAVLDELVHYSWTCYHCRGSEITVEKYERDMEKSIERLRELIQEYKKEIHDAENNTEVQS